jgi:hypothetical protein
LRVPWGIFVADTEITAFAASTLVSVRTTFSDVVQTTHMTVAHRDGVTTIDNVYEMGAPLLTTLTLLSRRSRYEQEIRDAQARFRDAIEGRQQPDPA